MPAGCGAPCRDVWFLQPSSSASWKSGFFGLCLYRWKCVVVAVVVVGLVVVVAVEGSEPMPRHFVLHGLFVPCTC